MNEIFVKPKAGMKIRRPDSGAMLPDEGANVPNTPFWQRRISDGDVEKMEVKQEAKSEKPAKAKGGEQ